MFPSKAIFWKIYHLIIVNIVTVTSGYECGWKFNIQLQYLLFKRGWEQLVLPHQWIFFTPSWTWLDITHKPSVQHCTVNYVEKVLCQCRLTCDLDSVVFSLNDLTTLLFEKQSVLWLKLRFRIFSAIECLLKFFRTRHFHSFDETNMGTKEVSKENVRFS